MRTEFCSLLLTSEKEIQHVQHVSFSNVSKEIPVDSASLRASDQRYRNIHNISSVYTHHRLLLRRPVHMHLHAIIQSVNHVARGKCTCFRLSKYGLGHQKKNLTFHMFKNERKILLRCSLSPLCSLFLKNSTLMQSWLHTALFMTPKNQTYAHIFSTCLCILLLCYGLVSFY